MNEEPSLRIAGLSLWATSREFEASGDYWDGNWLNVLACLDAPGCHIETAGSWLRTDDIARFADQLAILIRDLKGQAEIECMEPNLNVKIVCGARGQVSVSVEITPDHIYQEHRVRFEIDQSYLNDALVACRRLLEQFPVRGAASKG